MRKFISTALALLMVLTAVPCLFASAASYPDVSFTPATLNNYVSDGTDGLNRTVTLSVTNEQDGIEALLVEPNPDYVPLDKYSWQTMRTEGTAIAGRNVNAYYYRYVICDYYFVPYEGKTAPSMSISILNYRNLPNGVTPRGVTGTSATLESNRWARAVMDISAVATSGLATADSGTTYGQFHFMPLGNGVKAAESAGYIYIAGLTFATERPSGDPTVTSISFGSDSLAITRGRSATIPDVTVTGTNSPLTNYEIALSGMSSAKTKLNGTSLYIGDDETSSDIIITATSVFDRTKTATLRVTVKDPAPRTAFDDNNVIYRFGVTSDTHVSGSWNQVRSRAKFMHMIEAFSKTAAYDSAKIDAIIINGDFVDSINGTGNVQATASYGTKGEQNFREVNYVAQTLWGSPDGVNNFSDTTTGVGDGILDGTRFFYALGNHDEGGRGKTGYSETTKYTKGIKTELETGTYSTVYSAEYYAAVICGWQYDINKSTRPDGSEDSYRDYIRDLCDYCTNPDTTVTAEAFEASYGVTLASAAAKFEKFYGFDLDYSYDKGLFYGNRHMVLGEGDDAIHFVAIELSQSSVSQEFARKICEQSVAENPHKPIFFVTHYKINNTIYASDVSSNMSGIANVLKDYPQAIIWGGHSHSYMHNDDAIGQFYGFTQVESATNAYLWNGYSTRQNSKGASTSGAQWPENFNTHENHNFANGCYVEVDKNFNVRINRLDLYRSFSADYAEDTTVYTDKSFTQYAESSSSEPVNAPVYIRTPWDITDISSDGENVTDYTTARLETNGEPYFESDSNLTLTGGVGTVKMTASLNAKDDGMVYMYVVELFKDGVTDAIQRYYYTNFFFNYQRPEDIPVLNISKDFVALDPATTYTVKVTPVDEYDVSGEPLTATATTKDGLSQLVLPDGRIALFVDCSETPVEEYEFEGTKYVVLPTLDSAFAAGADVVYYIAGETNLVGLGLKKPTEIIGIDREKAGFAYDATATFAYNVTFKNVYFNKKTTGDTAINLAGKTVTLDSVKASANPLNIFNTGWGSNEKSGSLVVKGDTGIINAIYYGPNFSQTATSKGDLVIKLEGGTFKTVGTHKAAGSAFDSNKIDGNIFVDITGGTYTGNIYGGHSSQSANVKKNIVVKILGGDLSAATVGRTGNVYVEGKEIFVFKKGILNSTKNYLASNKAVLITVPDDMGGLGDAIYDDNGYITGFNITQVDNKVSYVNGKPTKTVSVEDANTYDITYEDGSDVVLDENGNVTGIITDKETVIVSEYVDGVKVTGIKAGAFDGKTVGKIVLPDSVTAIESGAISTATTVYCPVSATEVISYATANGNTLKYLGDVDGNGSVNGADLTLIARKLMGFVDTGCVDDALVYDANIDKRFSLVDLSALMKQLSK